MAEYGNNTIKPVFPPLYLYEPDMTEKRINLKENNINKLNIIKSSMNKRKILFIAALLLSALAVNAAGKIYKPWSNGRLVVSENNRYIVHENGQPFFWMGNTAWLLPERLNREEAEYFLEKDRLAGYNVEQIQVLNAIPTFNVYGHAANNAEFDFSKVSKPGVYGYWEHLD